MSKGSQNGDNADRRFRNADPLRAMLLDTMPEELLLTMSSVGAYANLTRLGLTSVDEADKQGQAIRPSTGADQWITRMVGKLLAGARSGSYEIPYTVSTITTEGKKRSIAVPHLRSQWRFALFIHEQADSILNLTSASACSLRAPERVGSSVVSLVSGEESGIDGDKSDGGMVAPTETREERRPKRFFVYRGYDWLYRFYESVEFLDLERRFSRLRTLDVASAFPSIYTHSLAWAIRGKAYTKGNLGRENRWKKLRGMGRYPKFADAFDRIMQQANWNETNGIIVGPEVSRIFAEILFQQVERRALSLVAADLEGRFEVRRYVDDFFVFSHDDSTLDIVEQAIADSLQEYNLQLNASKTSTLNRPFVGSKGVFSHQLSSLIDDAMSDLSDSFAERMGLDAPGRARVLARWKRDLVRDVRVAASQSGGTMAMAMSRVPAALKGRAIKLLREFGHSDRESELQAVADELDAIADTCGQVVAYQSTDSAALCLAVCIVCSARVNKRAGEKVNRHDSFERILGIGRSALERFAEDPLVESSNGGNVVRCNVLLGMSELPRPFVLSEDALLRELQLEPSEFSGEHYFEVITYLYYQAATEGRCARSEAVVARVHELLEANGHSDAGSLHMALDVAACPAIPRNLRVRIVRTLRQILNLPEDIVKTNVGAESVLERFEQHPWFVDWHSPAPMWSRVRRGRLLDCYER